MSMADGPPWLVLVIRGLNLISGFKFKRTGGEFSNDIGNQTQFTDVKWDLQGEVKRTLLSGEENLKEGTAILRSPVPSGSLAQEFDPQGVPASLNFHFI